MNSKKTYETESLNLAKACEIAIEALEKFPPSIWDEKTIRHVLNCYIDWKDKVLNPEPKFKNLGSLKYKINDVFTFFQEGSGDFVEYFWKEIKNKNLPYLREDKLEKILKRGKIKNLIEFNYVTDTIIPAEQENKITHEDFKVLSEMLSIFENKKENKL